MLNNLLIMFLAIGAIVSITAAATPAEDLQDKVNEKVDGFLSRYTRRVSKESPYYISKPDYFYKNTNLLSGNQIVNGTKIFGLADLKRHGNVSATLTGEHIWRLSGYLNLTAPLIEGSLFMVNAGRKYQEVKYVSTSASDLYFKFSVVINTHWKRLLMESLSYAIGPKSRIVIPDFPVTLDCPLDLNKECNSATDSVYTINKNAVQEIIVLVQRLLTLTPMFD